MLDITIRLFGKLKSSIKRRMGVALAFDADVKVARVNAKKAVGMVKPGAIAVIVLKVALERVLVEC